MPSIQGNAGACEGTRIRFIDICSPSHSSSCKLRTTFMFLHDIHKKKNILNPVLKNSHIEKLYIFAPAFGKRSEETINIQYNILQKT